MELVQTVDDFDKLLVQVVEEIIKYCLGDANAGFICNYLKDRNYSMSEIPYRPEVLSEELRNLLGFGSKQILCAPSILEETILEALCKKLGVKLDFERPPNFPDQVRKLRAMYIARMPVPKRAKNGQNSAYTLGSRRIIGWR
jgi:hypothetical protein